MPKFKNILYATDLSHSAPHAFGYAMMLAKQFDAHMTVLYVIERLATMEESIITSYLGKDATDAINKSKEEDAMKEMAIRVEDFFCKEGDHPVDTNQVTFKVDRGYPEDEILKHAKDYDLIVMGTHEKGFTHTFLGSVTKRVLRRSRTPVFVVPLIKALDK